MSETRNVVIIGSGCSGHTAALYTARANLKPLVIEGHEPGGQLSMTTWWRIFPDFPKASWARNWSRTCASRRSASARNTAWRT